MVVAAITDDAQDIVFAVRRVAYRNIYLETGTAHPGIHFIAVQTQLLGYAVDQGGVGVLLHLAGGNRHAAVLGKLQESLQTFHTPGTAPVEVYLLGLHGGEHHHLCAGTADCHVETTFAANIVEGAEIHGDTATAVWTIAHGEQDDITLVSLDILQVLDEDGLLAVIG